MPSSEFAALSMTQRVAEFIVHADTSVLPQVVRERGCQTILDTFGCVIAGLRSDVADVAVPYAGLPAPAQVDDLWGTHARPLTPEMAAVVGGALGAALDYDDVSLVGHPSSILVAAIMSSAADQPLSGAQLLDAYLVGYEVSTRVGQAYHLPHSRYGWHTTSTAGYFGAVAAVARLRGLSVVRTATALGIAASQAAGLGRNFGTTTKPFHSGFAARGGIAAVRLAELGATAGEDILDGPRGFVEMYSLGDGDAAALDALGAPWVFETQGSSLKKFPACYASHRVIDAVLDVQRVHDLLPEEIDRMVVRAPTKSIAGLMYTRPVTGLQGKFSAQYAAAAALIDREVTIASFEDDQVARPAIVNLIEKIDVAEDPRCRPEDPEAITGNPISGGFWEVTVHTTDGSVHQSVSAVAPGAPGRDLTVEETVDKFVDCALSVGYDPDRAREIAEHLRDLNAVADIRAVLTQLGQRA